jgi:hypothetical protein
MIKYYVKQYGAQRTGTNVLRVLLKCRFVNIEVLMHALGDKHLPPIDYDLLRANLKHSPSYYEEICRATNCRPSATTNLADHEQARYLNAISQEVANAILEDRLLFFISVKNPYSWAYSFLKFHGLLSFQSFGKGYLADACLDFNRQYKSWLSLIEEFPHRTQIIRFEELISNPEGLATSLSRKHHFQLTKVASFVIDGIVLPAHWDNVESAVHFESFDQSFYISEKYYNYLTPPIIQIVHNTIDWTLMQHFGYPDTLR